MTVSPTARLSIAERSKIRMLVGDQEHLARVSMMSSSPSGFVANQGHGNQAEQTAPRHHRKLQDQDTGRSTFSAHTLAIVFSVCVGVCGYLLQAWTSNKASQHTGEL